MKIRNLPILVFCILLLVSCQFAKNNFLDQNSGNGISVIRYDRLQYEYAAFDSYAAVQKMNTTYSWLTQTLLQDVLGIGQVFEDGINQKMQAYFQDSTRLQLLIDVQEKFADISHIEKGLTKGFKRLQKEIPGIRVPEVYTQVSALNESVVIVDSLLAISLDKYMGTDYPLYSRYYHPYQCSSMIPERILPDCFRFYLLSEYLFPDNLRGSLLEIILYRGKINYVVQEILGYKSAEKMIGYSNEEITWCKENRKQIWEYINSTGQLNTTDPMVIRRYIHPAPHTSYFGENSPAFIGVWLGMEIVSSYMKHNNISIRELLEMNDYRKLLEESRFKP
ncbi:gliding motility lipoprotein GldB [Bacteroides sp. 214]|uniref:gliding motility protein GldB-related protein n=1 Tax=Bacteroides sp. 214 TaxID=2302935 RepID=UPI0013D5A8D5|nr:gliding motility lipoprotein GldB [Bacteroides sp. 214]NDW13005.1 gliding motility lipoprotein GldB [Bacteroides sp. 214]